MSNDEKGNSLKLNIAGRAKKLSRRNRNNKPTLYRDKYRDME